MALLTKNKAGSNGPPVAPMPSVPQLPVNRVQEAALSLRGAAFVDEIDALERERDKALADAHDLLVRTQVAEKLAEDLRTELNHLRNDRDQFHNRYTRMREKFDSLRLIIADVMREGDHDTIPETPPSLPSPTLQTLADAIEDKPPTEHKEP